MDQFKETLMPGDELNFLIPWYSDNSNMEAELERELIHGHILYGKKVKTVARRQDNDDVLFEVFDADYKFAKVHLTWIMKPETSSAWPRTELYKDWKEVYEICIIPDNKDWEESEKTDDSKTEDDLTFATNPDSFFIFVRRSIQLLKNTFLKK
jgi:hypothetical protein